MRLMRIGELGHEVPVVAAIVDGTEVLLDARPLTVDYVPEFFAGDGMDRLRQAVSSRELAPFRRSETDRIGAPIARPGAVICIGMNYAAHAAESGKPPPSVPIVFLKHPNTIVGPNDDVRIPRGAEKLDWEVELAIVIGKTARYLESADQAMACVAGYTIANDVSERALQIEQSGGQWSKGKCCEDFFPLGPALVVDEVPDPQALGLRCLVNGEIRQSSTTSDMIFDVATIISTLSQCMVLSPGDVVSTGTPEGVALSGRFSYLHPGDVMELEIDGLGAQRQVVGSA